MRTTSPRKLSPVPTTTNGKSDAIKNFLDLPGCEFTETGLTIAPGLKYEHWERIGEILKRVESGVQWWIGDWMTYGEQRYGEKQAQALDAHEETGRNVDTLRNYQWVAEHVPVVRRLTTLSWSHHQAIAALKPKEQVVWLERAQAEGLSYRELRREVDKSERAKNFRLVGTILEKIWDRIQDGCYTADAIIKCGECGKDIFDLDATEIKLYMQQLVGSGKAEWRNQGGRIGQGEPLTLCVPKGMPAGSDLDLRRSRGDDEEHF